MVTINLSQSLSGKNLSELELKDALESGAFEMTSALYLNTINAFFVNEFECDFCQAMEFHNLFSAIWGKYVPDCIEWSKKVVRKRLCSHSGPIDIDSNGELKLESMDSKHPRHEVILTVEQDKDFEGDVPTISLMALALGRYRSDFPKFGAEIDIVCIDEILAEDELDLRIWAESLLIGILTGFGAEALKHEAELLIVTHDKIVYDELKAAEISKYDPKNRTRIVLED